MFTFKTFCPQAAAACNISSRTAHFQRIQPCPPSNLFQDNQSKQPDREERDGYTGNIITFTPLQSEL